MKFQLFIECPENQQKALVAALNTKFSPENVTKWRNGVSVDCQSAPQVQKAARIAEITLK